MKTRPVGLLLVLGPVLSRPVLKPCRTDEKSYKLSVICRPVGPTGRKTLQEKSTVLSVIWGPVGSDPTGRTDRSDHLLGGMSTNVARLFLGINGFKCYF